MGLFDFLKKGTSVAQAQPLEYYLNQRTAWALCEMAEKILTMINTDSYCGVRLSTDCKVEYLRHGKAMPVFGFEEIPKCYYNIRITPETIWKIALQKGSATAAFYLATLYEHGIGVEKNQGFANQYHDLALQVVQDDGTRDHGYYYEQALRYIKNGRMNINSDFTSEPTENLAMSLWHLGWPNVDRNKQEILEIVQSEYRIKDLGRIGAIIVCHYAQMGYPYSMGMVSETLSLAEYRDEELYRWWDEKEIDACQDILIRKLIKMATAGNTFAVNMLSSLDIQWQPIY